MKSPTALAVGVAAVLLMSSCTGTQPDGHAEHPPGSQTSVTDQPAQQPASSNAADVAFATDMIPHHEQAVAMAGLVPGRSTDPAVVRLATEISAAQGPEIETMKALLVQWSSGTDDGQGDDEGGMTGMKMPGMVDDATMAKLATLTGAQFDTLWLSSMIGHHQGAIAMANAELRDGVNTDAKHLAQQIITTQLAEIGQMATLERTRNG